MNIHDRLRGADRNSSEIIASEILRNPDLFTELFEAMFEEDPVVRAQAAAAAEKVTRGRPDLLVPFRKRLIAEGGELEGAEVRRNVAQMLPRVKLEPKERSKAVALLERYMKDESAIVVASAMFSLADFSNDDAVLRERIIPVFERLSKEGTGVVQSRGRMLFARLSSQQNRRRPGPQPRR